MLNGFLDCPNGFIHLNNKCYRWLPPNLIDQHLRSCHLYRGNLLQVSPENPANEMVAKYMMTLYASDTIYAGIRQIFFYLQYSRQIIEMPCFTTHDYLSN